jgi:nitrogen-specific signal transduction histidine kinase/CheY-like chemotaxis protein
VAQRTQELQQANLALLRDMEERKKLEEQLLQAQKMEGIGTLAGGIAHDFNNILNIIQGYASSLSSYGAQNGEVGDCLAIINETVQRGSALVQQLLTLARKNGTQWESVDANAVIEKLMALIAQTFPKNIELKSSLGLDLPPIMADKNQIEQALLNLCVNARDAMPNGGRLVLSTQAVEGPFPQDLGDAPEESCYVVIEVSDTGTGMDESVRPRIFEPFFTTKNAGQGTGLGLSVVYGIVKSHKGAIHVESSPHFGTIFRLSFPVLQAALKPITEVMTPINAESEQQARSRAAILIVEDEKHMLYLMEKILLRYGYQVFTATDGEQALEVYQRQAEAIDVVLLDIGLPKITGLDVLRKLRQKNRNVNVVVASGYLDPDLKSEIADLGVQHFVDKPYRFDQLVETLEDVIENKPTLRQAQPSPA